MRPNGSCLPSYALALANDCRGVSDATARPIGRFSAREENDGLGIDFGVESVSLRALQSSLPLLASRSPSPA